MVYSEEMSESEYSSGLAFDEIDEFKARHFISNEVDPEDLAKDKVLRETFKDEYDPLSLPVIDEGNHVTYFKEPLNSKYDWMRYLVEVVLLQDPSLPGRGFVPLNTIFKNAESIEKAKDYAIEKIGDSPHEVFKNRLEELRFGYRMNLRIDYSKIDLNWVGQTEELIYYLQSIPYLYVDFSNNEVYTSSDGLKTIPDSRDMFEQSIHSQTYFKPQTIFANAKYMKRVSGGSEHSKYKLFEFTENRDGIYIEEEIHGRNERKYKLGGYKTEGNGSQTKRYCTEICELKFEDILSITFEPESTIEKNFEIFRLKSIGIKNIYNDIDQHAFE